MKLCSRINVAPALCLLAFLVCVRPVYAQDAQREAAQKLVAEAEQLVAKGAAEAKRAALEKFREAAALFHALGDKEKEAAALNDVGALYDGFGERRTALEFYLQALPLRREAGDQAGEAVTLNNMGVTYRGLGETRRALESYRQALALIRAGEDRASEAAMLNNIGAVYRALGELQQALDAYAQALPLWQTLKNTRGEAVTLSNLGGVYRSLGEQEKALEFYEKSLVRAREAKDRRVEGETLNNLGATQRSLNQPEKALEFFNQALSLRKAVGDKRGEAITLNNLGGVAAALNDIPKAIAFYEQALQLWRGIGDRSGEANGLHNLGSIYQNRNETANALKHYDQALALRRAIEDKNGEAATLYLLARLQRDAGRLGEARGGMESVLAIVEDLRSKIGNQDLRAAYFSTVQQYYDFYIALLMDLHRQTPDAGFAVRAWQAGERARARSLLDLLQEAKAELRVGADEKLLAREQELLESINTKVALQAAAYGNPQRAEQAKTLGAEITQLSGEYETLQAKIRQGDPRYAALTKSEPPTLAEAQKLLDRQTVLLSYKLGEEKSFLWLITPESFLVYELPARAALEKEARQLYEALTERNRQFKDETAAQRRARLEAAAAQLPKSVQTLNQTLLAPVAVQTEGKRLAVIADGALEYIPFSVLSEAQEIVNLPSLAALPQLRRESGKRLLPNKLAAVFADPVFERDDPRLPPASVSRFAAAPSPESLPRLFASRDEAAAIVSFAPRQAVFSALGFAANRETAVRAELGEYRILHFATHGLLNTARPEFSGLALSLYDEKGQLRDGFLRLNQIYRLRLQSELVVLSACRTALGKEVKGEGLVGLTRGFMYAGAPRVIASLWKVDDEATAELMKLFYRQHLQRKLPAAQALRAAQTELRQQSRWRAPYYWAAFVLQGDWR